MRFLQMTPHDDHDASRHRSTGRSPAYKPGSVDALAYVGRSFLSAFNHSNALAAYPRLNVLQRCGRDGPSLTAYLALLRLGFALPSSLPMTRWALTPPFHPYRNFRYGGLFSVALSVTRCSRVVCPGVTWQPALWSPDFPRRFRPEPSSSRPSGRRRSRAAIYSGPLWVGCRM